MFKSRRDKEMEQRILIKRTMSNIRKYITNLETQKEKYIDTAKQAKLKGANGQYNLAVSGLKTAMGQQKKAEEMLLNFELTAQMRDLTSMTGEFLKGMGVLSREMSKISDNMDFVKVQKEFEQAMVNVENTTENLDLMMESSQDSFSSIASGSTKVTDDEIASLIDVKASETENNLDQEIEEKLQAVKKSLSENN